MTYEEMKESHEAQIEALLAEDWEELERIFPDVNLDADNLIGHNNVWGNTGDELESLFSTLPGGHKCLTQIKAFCEGNTYGYPKEESEVWYDKLGLGTNRLIPAIVNDSTVFTEKQLREFSRLQLLVYFPDDDRTQV